MNTHVYHIIAIWDFKSSSNWLICSWLICFKNLSIPYLSYFHISNGISINTAIFLLLWIFHKVFYNFLLITYSHRMSWNKAIGSGNQNWEVDLKLMNGRANWYKKHTHLCVFCLHNHDLIRFLRILFSE